MNPFLYLNICAKPLQRFDVNEFESALLKNNDKELVKQNTYRNLFFLFISVYCVTHATIIIFLYPVNINLFLIIEPFPKIFVAILMHDREIAFGTIEHELSPHPWRSVLFFELSLALSHS